MKTYLLILTLLVRGSALMAQKTDWEPVDGDRSWGNESNWSNGFPGSSEVDPNDGRARFRGQGICNVTSDVSPAGLGLPSTYRVELGDNQNGAPNTLVVKKGGYVLSERADNFPTFVGFHSPATLIVETGGVFTAGGPLYMTHKNSSLGQTWEGVSVIKIDGGTVNIAGNFGMDWDNHGTENKVHVNKGTLNLAKINYPRSISDKGEIIIDNGKIVIEGNKYSEIRRFIADGKIVSNDGSNIDVVFHGGITTVMKGDVAKKHNSLPIGKVSISPEPADDYLSVSLANDVIQSIEIIHLSGRVSASREYDNVNEATIQLQDVAEGLYIVKIKGKESTDFEKVNIKQ